MAALPYIVFDVNETLLDLETMEPTFQRIFGDKLGMRLWFANFIMYSAALTVANSYVPFTGLGAAVMKMLADVRGVKVSDRDRQELTERFSTTPPHPEVPAALRKLRSAGFRLFTLTDNLIEVQERLIACHTWDTLGAVAAGWEAALITRPWNDVLGVGPQPQIVGEDLNDVADQLIARHGAKM